ncbi:pleckstrin homology domain-containing family S member 1 isoform X2 [Lissotriton helveticus]
MRSNDRRRSSDGVRDSTCFYSGEVIKHGFLTKSPPAELFSKQSSWKRRYFLLIKMSRNAYSLQYYASQNLKNQCKGVIRLDEVQSVCHGIKNWDKMAAVHKMFKCSPEHVITISTNQRDYYLIGNEEDQVKEWLEAIRQAREETWKDIETQTPREDTRLRTISLPVCSSSSDPFLSSARTIEKAEGTQLSAPRPYSDPYNYCSSTETTTPPLARYSEYHCQSKPEASEANDSPDEGIYDIPSYFLRCIYCRNEDGSAPGPSSSPKCTHPLTQVKRDLKEPADLPASEHSDESEDDEENEAQYVYMSSIPQLVQSVVSEMDYTATASSSQDPLASPVESNRNTELGFPESTYDVITMSVPVSDESSRCEEGHAIYASPLKQRCSIERRNCKKRRSTPSLRRLFNSEDPSLFFEENISLPKEGLSTYMELMEFGEKVCVSHWKGPGHMACPFHFGDHIVGVNEIGVQSKEDVFRSITMARSEKVKITVLRVPNSEVLHVEGCSCP